MKKPDPTIVAILLNREHSRLSSQVKTLEKVLHAPYSDKEHQRLVKLAVSWRESLAFDDGAPKLAEALETYIVAYRQQSADQERLHGEVVFAAGIYRMGHWGLVKHFIPGINECLDNFGAVLSKHRDAFKRRYEADSNLTVEEQSRMLKAEYALITNRRDPYKSTYFTPQSAPVIISPFENDVSPKRYGHRGRAGRSDQKVRALKSV